MPVALAKRMRAVFFDLDGTLADSLAPLQQVHRDLLFAHGVKTSHEEFEELNGIPLPEMVHRILERHRLQISERDLFADYSARIDSEYRRLKPFDAAAPVLARLRESGWRTGLVTSNSGSRTRDWLKRNQLDSRFDAIVCAEDVSSGKPDPECYLKAVELASADRDKSFVVEDSEIGIKAARAAGLQPVFVGDRPIEGTISVASLSQVLNVLGVDGV